MGFLIICAFFIPIVNGYIVEGHVPVIDINKLLAQYKALQHLECSAYLMKLTPRRLFLVLKAAFLYVFFYFVRFHHQ
ncbi:DUF411 domain-containing protein [Moritella yayanosii]